MSELSQLSPQPLWDIFAKICSIPHPSYHEEQLAEHIMGWAKEKGLHAERDQVGNILIRKGATAGMENRKPVALQAHLDMVPQKNNDTVHDFAKDPIQPYIDGEWVKARGTTLGADNGIGMASALAVLADDSVAHGPLEVLLTHFHGITALLAKVGQQPLQPLGGEIVAPGMGNDRFTARMMNDINRLFYCTPLRRHVTGFPAGKVFFEDLRHVFRMAGLHQKTGKMAAGDGATVRQPQRPFPGARDPRLLQTLGNLSLIHI